MSQKGQLFCLKKGIKYWKTRKFMVNESIIYPIWHEIRFEIISLLTWLITIVTFTFIVHHWVVAFAPCNGNGTLVKQWMNPIMVLFVSLQILNNQVEISRLFTQNQSITQFEQNITYTRGKNHATLGIVGFKLVFLLCRI